MKKDSETGQKSVLIAYATQLGTSKKLAEACAAHLRTQNFAAEARSTAEVTANNLRAPDAVFFIVATTGDGVLPASAENLARELRDTSLAGVKTALLALGDRQFSNFARAGRIFNDILNEAGADFLLPTRFVDGKPDHDWREWLGDLGKILGFDAPAVPELPHDLETSARLLGKTRLDDPSDPCRETAELIFRLPENIPFRGGDLALITPPGAKTARNYSVGSDSAEGPELRLTVGLDSFLDEDCRPRNGRCSGWLLHDLAEGESINLAIRPHPSFTVEENDDRPVIMAAAGTGMAPFVGFIAALKRRPRETWLFYGNAAEGSGFLYRELWERAQRDGIVTNIRTVFDNQNRGFVQDEILRCGEEIYSLIAEREALIYVCGKASTVGDGVASALKTLHLGHAPDDDAEAWLNALRGDGRLREDLFG